ncbi:DNA-binding transcriptional regulator YbjK [Rhodococcus triatomae]|uniref:DNA-binding transcriptional regulator YbjK n=1 Tax=Rhodococcus triatomae TaxID=300028 RepID=A0A1G8B7M0_9NOCA|nr:DNA-binding transcriptional regulator YbjK [Rhodococcus triatomae]
MDAAADLLLEGGFEAVRHRSVASRSGLPLASTTYYFESLDELIAAAVERNGARDLDEMRNHVRQVTHRRRGRESTVDLLVDLVVGSGDAERLAARYEWLVAAARRPELRDVQIRLRSQIDDVVAEACRRSDRDDRGRPRRLVSVIDGAMVCGIGNRDPDLRAAARTLLLDVIDVLAPQAEYHDGEEH